MQQGWPAAGFSTSFVATLMPLMAAQRLLHRSASTSETAELDTSKPIIWLFGVAPTIERYMIRVGVRLPIGGALFVLVRKQ